jgi:hypothetical protein
MALLIAVSGISSSARASLRLDGVGIFENGNSYQYAVAAYVENGWDFQVGDYFTLQAVPAVDPSSLSAAPVGNPSGPWARQITFDNNGPLLQHTPDYEVPFADVKRINAGFDVPNGTGSDKLVGTFMVQTWQDLPFNWHPEDLAIHWIAHIHKMGDGPIDDFGVVVLSFSESVPELRSAILPGAGLILYGLRSCHRRRGRCR